MWWTNSNIWVFYLNTMIILSLAENICMLKLKRQCFHCVNVESSSYPHLHVYICFDRMILPIISYGSEVWSYEKGSLIEKLHLKFCKYILGMKSSTPNVMVYGELGRYPIDIQLKLKALGYWLKLVNRDEDKLSCKMYECLLWLHYNHIFSSPWLLYIENILNT